MKRRKTKRLLAGLLALVMVLSLCEITLGQSKPVKAAVGLQNPTTDGNGVQHGIASILETTIKVTVQQKNQLNGEFFPWMEMMPFCWQTKTWMLNRIMRKIRM